MLPQEYLDDMRTVTQVPPQLLHKPGLGVLPSVGDTVTLARQQLMGYKVIVDGDGEQGLLPGRCLAIDGQRRLLMPSSPAPPCPRCCREQPEQAPAALRQPSKLPCSKQLLPQRWQRAEVARAGTAACLRT